ncbi:hypothetical protein N7G274_004284 [Stereocaulon virgatum]|uniref:NAD(P)-binding protein n=1 Tax=Stereocaulon virgatum TaxID=373712 RepID=A0ABR4ACL2_9LECA
MSFQGRKTILITGCSPGGIGYALARQFYSRGLHVFATARNEKAIADLTALEGIEALPLEVTSPESISELKNQIVERTGGSLDYLVNNAGRNYTVPALDLDFTEVENCFDINVISVMRMCQAFAPLLIQASGTIINIGSAAADLPYVFGSVYNASKAAMHSYTDTLRVELAPFEVKVMLVVATGVKTNVLRVHRDLPADSVFFPLNAEYRQRQLQPREKGMSATDFAAELVEAALKPKPAASRWIGPKATMVWFLLGLFPNIYWQYHFSKLVNMDKLARIVKHQKKIT